MVDTVLLIARDKSIAKKVRDACQELQAELTQVDRLEDARDLLETRLPDLTVCDHATFEKLRASWPRACVLLYGAPADSEQAIESIRHGAIDYVVGSITPGVMLQHIRNALRISRDIHVPAVYESRAESADVDRIIGESPAMKELYKLVGLIAPRDINVLITGESGTGKEMVARALLHHSPRKDRPFLALNCAAIPETLLESELFGHEKGAFTGADVRRIGKFEQCDGGTLFLDEIGDMPLATQVKLLRMLADHAFQRLGGTELIKCDVRILTATNQSLDQLIHERRFREDLYHRLLVAAIHVPPLREREVDAVLLAHYYMTRYNRRLGAAVQSLSPEVLPVLIEYPWPGNVRELENAVKSALVVARGSVLRLEHLPAKIRGYVKLPLSASARQPIGSALSPDQLRTIAEQLASDASLAGHLHKTATSMMEREMIRACLDRTRGQIAPAAKLLGISRTTLRKKMVALGVRITTSFDASL